MITALVSSLSQQHILISAENIAYIDYLVGNALNFRVDGKEAFEVPLGNVSHAVTGKNEVTLEFHQNDEAAVSLMELRFHVPTTGDAIDDPVQVSAFHDLSCK